jgi:hypothetical protein
MKHRKKTRLSQPAIAMLAVSFTMIAAITIPGDKDRFLEEKKPAKNEKSKSTFTSLNNESVKIYPDAWKREMHVVAKENEGKAIDFFVFDLEGTLVHNYKMKPKDHNRISGLKRGTYIYRVFCGDEETASGKFEIR